MTVGQGALKQGVISVVGKLTQTTFSLDGSAYGAAYYNSVSISEVNVPNGIQLSYDAAGQRSTAYSRSTEDTWQYESYRYDDNGRLSSILRAIDTDSTLDSESTIQANLSLMSKRTYDQANRIVQTDNYDIEAPGTRTDYRTNVFDGAGHTVQQQVYSNTGGLKSYMKWTYEAAGNIRSYTLQNYSGTDYKNTYTYDYRRFDTYRESRVTGVSDYYLDGRTDESYDHNGNLTHVDDSTDNDRDRTMTYDLTGHIIKKNSNSDTQHYLYAEGAQRASYGDLDSIDVDEGYTPIADTSIGTTPGSYTVAGGESLQNIAVSVWGDASLWYLIAEANGLNSGATLTVGESLVIPNRVTNTRNSADVVKPYNPGAIIGDTTPNLPNPPPPSSGGCGALGMILMVVVAIIVTIYTAGAAAGAMASMMGSTIGVAGGTMAVGAAAMSGAAAITGAIGVAGAMAAAAIGAAVGSIASQLVGMATGDVQEFSWKQVGTSALSAGLTAGVGSAFGAGGVAGQLGVKNAYAAAAVNAATSNAMNQGMLVATGLQDKFDWRSVAVSAIAAPLTKAVGDGIFGTVDPVTGETIKNGMDWARKNNFAANLANNLIGGALTKAVQIAVYKEGKMEWKAIAADAFGNTIGNALTGKSMQSVAYKDFGAGMYNIDDTFRYKDDPILLAATGDIDFGSGGLKASKEAYLREQGIYELEQYGIVLEVVPNGNGIDVYMDSGSFDKIAKTDEMIGRRVSGTVTGDNKDNIIILAPDVEQELLPLLEQRKGLESALDSTYAFDADIDTLVEPRAEDSYFKASIEAGVESKVGTLKGKYSIFDNKLTGSYKSPGYKGVSGTYSVADNELTGAYKTPELYGIKAGMDTNGKLTIENSTTKATIPLFDDSNFKIEHRVNEWSALAEVDMPLLGVSYGLKRGFELPSGEKLDISAQAGLNWVEAPRRVIDPFAHSADMLQWKIDTKNHIDTLQYKLDRLNDTISNYKPKLKPVTIYRRQTNSLGA